jgi:hypothetical protein
MRNCWNISPGQIQKLKQYEAYIGIFEKTHKVKTQEIDILKKENVLEIQSLAQL